MRAPARLAAFAGAPGLLFGAAVLVGASLEPVRDPGEGHGHGAGHGAAHEPAAAGGGSADALPGLAVEQAGYRLEPEDRALPRGREAELAFRVVGPDGAPVTDFAVEHERRMHLIVVRHDLTGFQHLHPTMDAGGRWGVRLRLAEAGVYRAYADFSAGGGSLTLATDLVVRGPFTPRALPAPASTDATGRYAVELAAEGLAPGAEAQLDYDVRLGGAPVRDIEPYLGADGHLVALREGDLAFLHVHPEESEAPGRIAFRASFPSAGRYRLFLQFGHDGAVRTVAHTVEVSG